MVCNYTYLIESIFQKKQQTITNSTIPWYLRERELFSWMILGDNSSSLNLQQVNLDEIKTQTQVIRTKIHHNQYDAALKDLKALKKLIAVDTGRNVINDLLCALAGIVCAPVALLIGILCIVPSFTMSMPYLGKPLFFYDVFKWLIDSVCSMMSCLIFPIAIYQSVQTTGSINIFQGECSRIMDTIECEIDLLKNPVKYDYPESGIAVLPCMTHLQNPYRYR